MLRSAPHFAAWCAADPGPIVHSASPWVPALRSSVKNAAPRPDTEHIASHATGMTDLHSRKMRNADPGPIVHSASPWVPALRCIVKNAAPRPGHEMTALQPNYLWLFENRIGNLQAAAGWAKRKRAHHPCNSDRSIWNGRHGAGAPLPTPRLRWVASSAAFPAITTDVPLPADFSSNSDVTIAALGPIDND
jgi:ribulose-5-phosphate 4-epimerase/fuculose-1-phosphate aldolase